MFLGKDVFNVVNTLGYIGLLLLIYIHVVGKWKWSPALLFVLSSAILMIPAWGQSVLWVVGSANYMWSMLWVLLFLLPLRIQYGREESVISNPVLMLGYLFFGFVAAATNENVSVGLVAMVIVAMTYQKYVCKRTIPSYMKFAMVGTIAGMLFLLLAPGNYARIAIEGEKFSAFTNVKNVLKYFIRPYALMMPLFVVTALYTFRNQKNKYDIWWLYLIGATVMHFAMIGAPYYSVRSLGAPVVMLIVVLGILFEQVDFYSSDERRKLYRLLLAGVLIMSLQVYSDAFNDIKAVNNYDRQRKAELQHYRDAGIKEVKIKHWPTHTRYSGAAYNEYFVDLILISQYHLKGVK